MLQMLGRHCGWAPPLPHPDPAGISKWMLPLMWPLGYSKWHRWLRSQQGFSCSQRGPEIMLFSHLLLDPSPAPHTPQGLQSKVTTKAQAQKQGRKSSTVQACLVFVFIFQACLVLLHFTFLYFADSLFFTSWRCVATLLQTSLPVPVSQWHLFTHISMSPFEFLQYFKLFYYYFICYDDL